MSAWRRSTSSTKRLTERLWLNLSAMAATAVMAVEAAVMAAAAMVVTAAAVAVAVAVAAPAFGGAAVAAVAAIGAGGMAIGTGAVGITSPSFLLARPIQPRPVAAKRKRAQCCKQYGRHCPRAA